MAYGQDYSQNYKQDYGEGAVSLWNEGNLKNLRLHEAQEMINFGKVNPFGKNDDSGSWNYQVWKAGIDILYGEGQSKYKSDEIKYVDRIKDMVERQMKVSPPFQIIMMNKICDKAICHKSINTNQNKIQKLLERYEKEVKILNDAHGLSTRNVDDDFTGL